MRVNVAPSMRTPLAGGRDAEELAAMRAAQDPAVGVTVAVDHQGDALEGEIGKRRQQRHGARRTPARPRDS